MPKAAALALAATMLFASGISHSRPLALATSGCPIFHCNAEGTGVVNQSLIPMVLTTTNGPSLGSLIRQGCSGNGSTLTCLYSEDRASGTARGTLKLLNASTLMPLWGSSGAANSYNLDPTSATAGQVPVNFSNSTIAAGDKYYHVLYKSSGAVIGKVALGGAGRNLGMTPISGTYGVVSISIGQLTLINLSTWTGMGTLTLVDPATGGAMILASNSAGTTNVFYAVGYNSVDNSGVLYSIVVNPATSQLQVRSTFTFTGTTGASPVVVTPAVSGLSDNLILLAVPGLPGDSEPINRLVALTDSSAGLTQSWAVPLSTALEVSPTVDANSSSVFYQGTGGAIVYQSDLLSGNPIQSYNLQTIGGFPTSFVLNGHLGASQAGSVFTLLLAGAYTTTAPAGAQYVLTYQPIAAPSVIGWASQIGSQPVQYTAAWNFAPSTQTGVVCPIAIADTGNASALVRLCDH